MSKSSNPRIILRLPEPEYETLKQVAERENRTATNTAETIVKDFLNGTETIEPPVKPEKSER